jgi:cell division protease FtsH
MMVNLRVLSLLGLYPLAFSLKMTFDPDITYIQKHIPRFPELSYGTLLKRIDMHTLADRIYVSPSLDTVVLEHGLGTANTPTSNPEDDEAYETVHLNPIVLNGLVEKAQKQGIDTVFLSKEQPLPNIGQMAVGFFDSFIFPSILLYLTISFARVFFQSRSPGAGGISSSGMIPGINGLRNVDDPKDLKTRLKKENVSLASFAGSPEILEECTEIVSFLKNGTIYTLAGAELPRGILLEGPPGTGKTLLARAIASECDAAFLSVSASEFVELYVGMGAQKVRELFSVARLNSPCIMFIDEIDAIGKQRGATPLATNDEREQTLNQLLAEMDGFQTNSEIIVIAATNRKDTLDTALLRPGRFDRIIRVPPPDQTSRFKILQVHAKNKVLSSEIRLEQLAEYTRGFTGAQLKQVLNEAAIFAAREGRTVILQKDVTNALDKVTVGLIRKTDTRSQETKQRVAVHESGHAILVNAFSEEFELKQVSIQSTYNGAGGYTLFNERKNVTDGGLYTKDVLFKRLVITMGGKAAETLFYGDQQVSLGATQDLKQANELARQMITQFGFGYDTIETYYEREMVGGKSEYTQSTVDKQVQGLVYAALLKAKDILLDRKPEFDKLVERLIQEERVLF